MANKKAARKAMSQASRRAAVNGAVRGELGTLSRKLRAAIAADAGSVDTRRMARDYVSALDKAAKNKVVHRNSADRRKSAFARYVFS
ncbi:MAG: 30S ribosomal protein S20 [Puniceicoccales bacterium]|nr:30S ribosomal protein S20 [Puniceicoccales bacterium]